VPSCKRNPNKVRPGMQPVYIDDSKQQNWVQRSNSARLSVILMVKPLLPLLVLIYSTAQGKNYGCSIYTGIPTADKGSHAQCCIVLVWPADNAHNQRQIYSPPI